jgi:predicted CXXCH cytochrome family protein
MVRMKLAFLSGIAFVGMGVLVFITLSPSLTVQAGPPRQQTQAYCLGCHSNDTLSISLPSGESLSLYISSKMLAGSIHTQAGIECQACHSDISTYPHPPLEYASHRDLSRAYYLSCQKCHAVNYAKTLDSIHAQAAEEGNLAAPVCTDCHGAHYVRPPDQPRALISTTCGQCHQAIFEDYKESVHGRDMIEEDNPDVPVCTDCHGVHDIQDARTPQFDAESPELCAGCHADPVLMEKYELSAQVYDIYTISWHGQDVSAYKTRWPAIWHESAVCTDCHGIHDIRRTSDPASSVNPDNLLGTCQNCHAGVSENWIGAWTGHHEVSLARTPFVFYTATFYSSFVPFVLWLSGIYVGLQILRSLVERVKRSLR